MVRGGLGDDLANVGAAGEEDVIELFLQKGCRLRDAAGDDHHALRVHVLLDKPLHCHGGRGGQLARLDHDAVASGDGTDHWLQGELDGIVPGAHDKANSQGLAMNVGRIHESHEILGNMLVFDPTKNPSQE